MQKKEDKKPTKNTPAPSKQMQGVQSKPQSTPQNKIQTNQKISQTTTTTKSSTNINKTVNKPQQQEEKKNNDVQQLQQQVQQLKIEPLIVKKIKLTGMLNQQIQDKKDNKASFILDETGNAFTFFKYKGEVLDIAEILIKVGLGTAKKEELVEKVRKIIVYALKADGFLVFYVDLLRPNLVELFQGTKFFADPKKIFTYSEILNEKFHKSQILLPEEDVDYQGNKGFFQAKGKDFTVSLLCRVQDDVAYDADDILNKLGLNSIRNCFNTMVIEQ